MSLPFLVFFSLPFLVVFSLPFLVCSTAFRSCAPLQISALPNTARRSDHSCCTSWSTSTTCGASSSRSTRTTTGAPRSPEPQINFPARVFCTSFACTIAKADLEFVGDAQAAVPRRVRPRLGVGRPPDVTGRGGGRVPRGGRGQRPRVFISPCISSFSHCLCG